MSDGEWLDAGNIDFEDQVPVARNVGSHMIMVVRQGDAIHVTDAVCPHKFTMLTDGRFDEGCVTCPQHDATFDLRTGHAGDDTSWTGHLPVHEHRIEGDRLFVRIRG